MVSSEVVTALESIRHSVETMRNHVVTTVAAVEQQSALTRDMSSNMQNAAQAAATITENVEGISAAITASRRCSGDDKRGRKGVGEVGGDDFEICVSRRSVRRDWTMAGLEDFMALSF